MLPSYEPGDHVVVLKTKNIKKGDVVVIKSKINLIKRVNNVQDRKVFVSGDNVAESVKLKPIDIVNVVGKVVFKY